MVDAPDPSAAGGGADSLPKPPPRYVGPLWVIVVATFCVVLVGGDYLMYQLVQDNKSTEVIGPVVTGALGVLAGLLAPSQSRNGTRRE